MLEKEGEEDNDNDNIKRGKGNSYYTLKGMQIVHIKLELGGFDWNGMDQGSSGERKTVLHAERDADCSHKWELLLFGGLDWIGLVD